MVIENQARSSVVETVKQPAFTLQADNTLTSPVPATNPVKLVEGEIDVKYAKAILASREERRSVFRFVSEEEQREAANLMQKIISHEGSRDNPEYVGWCKDLNTIHNLNCRAAMHAAVA